MAERPQDAAGLVSGQDPRRHLPSVDRVLADPALAPLLALYGRERLLIHVRRELDALRGGDLGGLAREGWGGLAERLRAQLAAGLAAEVGPGLQRVLNATGVFLHTNLGRAPLPAAVAAQLPQLLDAYCDLELDLPGGRRGRRDTHLQPLLRALTGASAALVVNNNAAALALALAALAAGREVVVSRGELVEIGGSFRIPEILAATGARLVEVGTTNRTRLADYARAIGPQTALLLKVYPSNYRMTGFVASVPAETLAVLARERGVPLLVDEGSGLLRPHRAPQLREHSSMQQLLAADCDLVCGSGDKLLGGPQAGLLLGREDLIELCRRHPFYRAFRADRTVFASLEAVLRLHLADKPLPLDRLWPDAHLHRARLERVACGLAARGPISVEIRPAEAFVGGGAAPEAPIAGFALAIPGGDALQARLRLGVPPVVGYVRDGCLMLDLRTVDERDDALLIDAVERAIRLD
ncbi:MAG: L-seryl-tRNA(Sec) selenium transferase [Acidobacteriota bacterium]